jgi:hypothetical protein
MTAFLGPQIHDPLCDGLELNWSYCGKANAIASPLGNTVPSSSTSATDVQTPVHFFAIPLNRIDDGESAGRRDSVSPLARARWPSIYAVYLGAVFPKERRAGNPNPLFDLAPGGVYQAVRVTPDAGALLPHRFTLTCAAPEGVAIGGLFSVALSCRSPRLAVSQHPALWSPDLPRPGPVEGLPPSGASRGHLADSPSTS